MGGSWDTSESYRVPESYLLFETFSGRCGWGKNGIFGSKGGANLGVMSLLLSLGLFWETDFYTPPVLRGAAFFDNSAPAVYRIQGP